MQTHIPTDPELEGETIAPVIRMKPSDGPWTLLEFEPAPKGFLVGAKPAKLWCAVGKGVKWTLTIRLRDGNGKPRLELFVDDQFVWAALAAIPGYEAPGAFNELAERDASAAFARARTWPQYQRIVRQFEVASASRQGEESVSPKAAALARRAGAWLAADARDRWARFKLWIRSPRAILTTAYRFSRNTLAIFGLLFASYWILRSPASQAVAAAPPTSQHQAVVANANSSNPPAVPGALAPIGLPPAVPGAPGAQGMPPELRDISTNNQLTKTEQFVALQAVKRFNIQLRPKGYPYIVFSDPNCPSCRDLDPKLLLADPRFAPLIVPVAFKPGSEEAVKRIYCAKDRVGAWAAAVRGVAATGAAASDGQCEGADDVVKENNASFVALRFNSTPTLVSALGKVTTGSPEKAAQLNAWLDAQGGLPAEERQAAAAPAPAPARKK